MKRLLTWFSILAGTVTLIGGLYAIDCHYAKADRLELVEQSLKQYIQQNRANWLQERLYMLEDRYYNKEMPLSVKEEFRRLKNEHDAIIRKLDAG